MKAIAEPRWLKKYTKLKYLQRMLELEELHLGSPNTWEDENDAALVKRFSDLTKASTVRATCLTSAPDRFHFWAVFGDREMGVCLWFNRKKLLNDISSDKSLRASDVEYMSTKKLKANTNVQNLPFAKRLQYSDEQEFRILRSIATHDEANAGFRFSPKSLERIYLNPWLKKVDLTSAKTKVGELLAKDYRHVRLLQSRALANQKWIKAAETSLLTNTGLSADKKQD
jgi:hypothetical protein